MTSVFVVGNCHLYGMQRSLRFFDSALLVDGCHLQELGKRFGTADKFLEHAGRFDRILTLSFGDQWLPGLDSAALLGGLTQTTLYPTVTFGAFHPDVMYVFRREPSGRDGSPAPTDGPGEADEAATEHRMTEDRPLEFLPSPLGPYHSALALYGYRKGYGVARTMALFRAEVFEALGYLSAWDVAIDELSARPEAKAFGLGRMAMSWVRQGCFMHNPQHPKVGVVCDIAREAMSQIGLTVKHADTGPFIPDDLMISHIWPVYPEIGSYYGLTGHYTFKRQTGTSRWPEHMTLEEFISASYECFASHDLDEYHCERVDEWREQGIDF